jgi:3D (Asp-Asp-Asp) domain-containing protein
MLKHTGKFIFVVTVALLLGVIYGQQLQINEINEIHAKSVTKYCEKIIALENELKLNKQVISKFSDDIREGVKVVYEAQVNTATSYSNRVCETDSTPNITASNDLVADFTLAVSRDLYEQGWTFGKLVYIEELGEFVRIQDLMNKRFCRRVDVFNADTEQAIKFGKRRITAYLLDDIEVNGNGG